MTIATAIPTHYEIPFFEIPPTMCKVYSDGGHYVAVPYKPTGKATLPKREKTYAQESFDSLYAYTLIAGMKHAETVEYMRDNLCGEFDDDNALDEFIAAELKRKAHNLGMRKKRFCRKAFLNRWTHFVTVIHFYGHF